ncbi:MAG: phosphodiester glycosidase family protein [Vicinamibacterales bacterium]
MSRRSSNATNRARIARHVVAAVEVLVLASLASAPGAVIASSQATAASAASRKSLPEPRRVAAGVDLFILSDPTLLSPPGPVAVQALRLDPRRVTLRMALARDRVLGTETVPSMAARHGALAAINAGFFLPSGDPAGLFVLGRLLVSDTELQRGAVALTADEGKAGAVRLLFDQVRATLRVRLPLARKGGRTSAPGTWLIAVDGVDTVRGPGRLVWFTPRFYDHTDTTTAGTDWVLQGNPLEVIEKRSSAIRTAIPANGAVLSYGGTELPPALERLKVGERVESEAVFEPARGTKARDWARAEHVIGGAGLLLHDGKLLDDWSVERLRPGFTAERHPRTMIGTDGAGSIWLVTVDGRNPLVSLGMRFDELQAVARRLGLRNALNLDGGGSTTMVVKGEVVNHPSDPGGPRSVSDALLVFERR